MKLALWAAATVGVLVVNFTSMHAIELEHVWGPRHPKYSKALGWMVLSLIGEFAVIAGLAFA